MMIQEPPRPLPQSTIQAAGQAASDVIGGLKQQPILLAMVVLNALAVGVAIWFLRGLQESNTQRFEHMLTMIEKCMNGSFDRRQDYGPPPPPR
jgi:hypothetical protein